MSFTFLIIIAALLLCTFVALMFNLKSDMKGEKERNSLKIREEKIKEEKLPTKIEIKRIKDASSLAELETNLDLMCKEIESLIQDIKNFSHGSRSIKQYENKLHRVQELSRYALDCREKIINC